MDLQWGERRHLDIDGAEVHVECAGPVGAPSVVCLHGFASGTFTWAGVAPLLRNDLRVVAWDRPPFGRSSRPPVRRRGADPYALAAQLRQLDRLVDELGGGGRPLVLAGHSAGALLAVQAVLAEVVRPDALVLIAPALAGGPPPAVQALGRLPATGILGPAALRLALFGAEGVIRAVGRHRTALTDATAAEAARALRRPGTATALWHLTRTWQAPSVAGRLSELRCGVTVVAGADDRIVPRAALDPLVAATGADLHLLEHVGHAPQEQAPDAVAAILGAIAGGDGGTETGRW